MKKLLTIIASALVASTAAAETLKVFSSNMGPVTSYGYPSKEQKAAYSAFLNDNNIDFGYFCGPKATTYFGFTDSNYSVDNRLYSQAYGGIHVFIYRTADYTLLSRSEGSAAGNGKVEYAVVEHKTTGRQYAFVMPTGTQFDSSNPSKIDAYLKPIKDEIDKALASYPEATVLVGTTAGWGQNYTSLHTYLSGTLGMAGNQADAACGGIYASASPALVLTEQAHDSFGLNFADTKMCVATVNWRDQCVVTFKDYDGTELKEETVYQGDDATPPEDPERTGYAFTGWNGDYTNVQADMILTAQYSINHYNVTFQDWDGTQIGAVQSVEYGGNATPPADPVREGFRFIGWKGDYANVQSDTVVIAQYVEASATTYNVTFYDSDGTTVISRQEIAEGSDATPPNDPLREGYTFDHWDGNYQNVQKDEDLVAVYAVNRIPVTFRDYDGSLIEEIETDWNTAAVLPAEDPVRMGYTFAGWNGDLENVTEPRTAYATYEINNYIVTFKCENGAVVDIQHVNYLEAAATPTNPVPYEVNTVFWKWDRDYSSIVENTEVIAVFAPAVAEANDAASLHDALLLGLPDVSTVSLTADIDVGGAAWSPIDEFRGVFDGNGHTIAGLQNSATIFAKLYGTVRNLTIANVGDGKTTVNDDCGILAKYAYGARIENVRIVGCNRLVKKTNGGGGGFVAITGRDGDDYTVFTNCVLQNSRVLSIYVSGGRTGGFTSESSYTKFFDCVVDSDVPETVTIGDGCGRAGGFVGYCTGNVYFERCLNNAHVHGGMQVAQSGGVGGMVGGATGSSYMIDCTNTGYMTGLSAEGLGGMLGRTCKAAVQVTRCVNRGTIRATGFAALGSSDTGNGVGGIIGGSWGIGANVSVADSANFGALDSTTNEVSVGGLQGFADAAAVAFENSFNAGAVTSRESAGGLIGRLNESGLTLRNCGNSAPVTALGSENCAAGGFIGRLRINANNASRDIVNSMNAGAVSGARFAGAAIGTTRHSGNPGSGNSVNLKNCVLGGTVTGGQTGVINAGIESGSASVMRFTADDGCRLLADGPAADYYDQNGVPQNLTTPLETITAAALTDRTMMHHLDNYAVGKSWMGWIQGRDCPELSLFGKAYNPGCIIMFW